MVEATREVVSALGEALPELLAARGLPSGVDVDSQMVMINRHTVYEAVTCLLVAAGSKSGISPELCLLTEEDRRNLAALLGPGSKTAKARPSKPRVRPSRKRQVVEKAVEEAVEAEEAVGAAEEAVEEAVGSETEGEEEIDDQEAKRAAKAAARQQWMAEMMATA